MYLKMRDQLFLKVGLAASGVVLPLKNARDTTLLVTPPVIYLDYILSSFKKKILIYTDSALILQRINPNYFRRQGDNFYQHKNNRKSNKPLYQIIQFSIPDNSNRPVDRSLQIHRRPILPSHPWHPGRVPARAPGSL